MIVGIDEVGRGAWAGPLCVGAVALGGNSVEGLTDSKKLTKKRREVLTYELKRSDARVGVGWVSAKVIDRIGLGVALKLAAQKALAQVDGSDVDQIIIDGTIELVDDPRVTLMKQADLLVPSVSAASIIAKVARDTYMGVIADQFEGYGFAAHVGYGTAAHSAALAQHGPTLLHRLSFAPLKAVAMRQGAAQVTAGAIAEEAAASYLSKLGMKILERNWKTKWCEVDVVAQKDKVLYFVEVKYRRRDEQGDGLAAITPKKLRQMRYAADFWLHAHPGTDYQQATLAAMALSGEPPQVTSWLPNV
jgi:ribonuclease HII